MQKATLFKITPQVKREIIEIIDERVKEAHVTKEDFSELKWIVKDLGIKVGELAVAQKRTEKELKELSSEVKELAVAQKRTEKELKELSSEVKGLAAGLKETNKEVKGLAAGLKETNKQVGGISHTIGFRLEDESYKALPGLLEKDFGIKSKGALKRGHIKDGEGNYIEINIVGEASRNGREITIIGEGKSQLSKKDINDFIRKKLKRINGVFNEIFPVLITYMTSEYDVEEYAKKKGIALYYSYDF